MCPVFHTPHTPVICPSDYSFRKKDGTQGSVADVRHLISVKSINKLNMGSHKTWEWGRVVKLVRKWRRQVELEGFWSKITTSDELVRKLQVDRKENPKEYLFHMCVLSNVFQFLHFSPVPYTPVTFRTNLTSPLSSLVPPSIRPRPRPLSLGCLDMIPVSFKT